MIKTQLENQTENMSKSIFFNGIKSLTFFGLLIIVIFVYGVNIWTKYKDASTTFVTTSSETKNFIMPPITICMRNGLKPTVLKKYGINTIFDYLFRSSLVESITPSVWDAFIESSYILNRDFYITLTYANTQTPNEFDAIDLNIGKNQGSHKDERKFQVEVNEYHTSKFGTCYEMISNMLIPPPTGIIIDISFNKSLGKTDFPQVCTVQCLSIRTNYFEFYEAN